MYKILIAEDEKIVRDSYKEIIEKNIKGVEVQTVRSGLEAIESVVKGAPDIVLMDINMPGLKGLDAIREIKRKNGGIVFIVISAYDDFSFAQEAITLDVAEYIVKPILKDVLIEAVKRGIKKADELRDSLVCDIKSKEMAERVTPALEKLFIYSLILNEDYENIFDEYKDIFEIECRGGYITVISAAEGTPEELAGNRELLIYYLKKKRKCIGASARKGKIVLFFPSEEDIFEEIEAVLKSTIDKAGLTNWKWNIGSYCTIGELFVSYREAVYKTAELKSTEKEEKLLIIKEEVIKNSLKGRKKLLIDNLNEFERLIWSSDEKNKMYAEAMIEVLASIYRKNDIETKNKKIIGSKEPYTVILTEIDSFGEAFSWFSAKIFEICEMSASSNQGMNETIQEIIRYLNENFNKDIVQDEIAGKFYISPQYLSRLFKEQTGKNFSDYLIMLRLSKAKELLEETNMSIKDISYSVGYSDPNYFSRLFKKEMGISPSEYNR